MLQKLLAIPAKLFLGKGIDKKLPFLVSWYKKVFDTFAEEGTEEVLLPNHLKLLVDKKDAALGMFLRTKGEFEPVQTKLFLETLKEGNLVLDIGANVGYYTILASSIVGKKGIVYAFEPDPGNIALLQKNIALNNCTNVVVVEKALGDKNEESQLAIDPGNPGESKLATHSNKNTISIQTITLDSFVKKYNISHIDVIKIDIEGAELLALSGGKESLSKLKNSIIFSECNTKALKEFSKTPADLLAMLEQLEYTPYLLINEFDKQALPFSKNAWEEMLRKVTYFTIVAKK